MEVMAEQDVSITFRTSAKFRDVLDEIAHNMKRDRTFVINEAVSQYLWRFEEDKKAYARSRADFARGDYQDHDEFFDELEAELEQLEREREGDLGQRSKAESPEHQPLHRAR